jgi:hypothetical protein
MMKPENSVFAQPFLPSMNSFFSALFQCDAVGKPIPIRIIPHLQMPRVEFSARGLEPTSNRESRNQSYQAFPPMIRLPRPVYTGYGRTARDIRAVTCDEQKSEVRSQKAESRRRGGEKGRQMLFILTTGSRLLNPESWFSPWHLEPDT